MYDAAIVAIIIAVIGAGGGVWSAYISKKNQKETRDISAVLSNTKTPVDSLDQVVRLLQEELNRTTQRHDKERLFFNSELERLRHDHELDRKDWERAEFKLQAEIDKLITERVELLDQISKLKGQLSSLETQVRQSLDSVKKLEDI